MKVSPENWLQVEPLLTAALGMDPSARAAWLTEIDGTHPQAAPILRRMVAMHERAEGSGELDTVPKLASRPGWGDAHAPGERVGPFELLSRLGRGGMGEVWLARQADGRVEREVALKLPAIQQHGDVWRERFRRERDILAKLSHPHIARLYDAGVSEEQGSRGQPYMAMEYVEGRSLTEHAAAGKLDIDARLALFRQVLTAVAHAHRHLVVHRDLKPANILVDTGGQVKLLDFGIAKLVDDGSTAPSAPALTQVGGRLMTLRYAAPEQVSDGTISTVTDVYALGVVLHELLTGVSPYRTVRDGKPFTESALLRDEPALPSSIIAGGEATTERQQASPGALARKLSGDLDAIALKALRRDPADRYATVDQFDEDIARYLARRPVKARAGTWRYLAGRFVARHTLPIATAAAVVLTLAAGLVMVEQQRRVAVAEKARAEKHFASVRKLANTFMFDVHDKVAKLTGTLEVRELLMNTSLQYLDSLSAEAANDPALAAELATAYRKVANIQGEPGDNNLGRLGDSIRNYEKSAQLFDSLGDYGKGDLRLQRSKLRVRYSIARHYAQAKDPRWHANMETALAIGEHCAGLPDSTSLDKFFLFGLYAEKALQLSLESGQTPEVGALLERAVSGIEALYQRLPDDRVVAEGVVQIYQRASFVYGGTSSTPESLVKAIAIERKAIALATQLEETRKPDSPNYLDYVRNGLIGLGGFLVGTGKFDEGEALLKKALDMTLTALRAEPNNQDLAARALNGIHNLTMAAFDAKKYESAVAYARQAFTLYAGMSAESRKIVYHRDYMATIYGWFGLSLLELDRPTAGLSVRRGRLEEACKALATSVNYIEEKRVEKLGVLSDPRRIQPGAGLTRCRAALAALPAS